MIIRDEILAISKSHEGDHTSNVSAYSLSIPKEDLRIVHHNEMGADGQIHSEVVHDLTTYPELTIAFVATGLKNSGEQLSLQLSRENGNTKTRIQDITISYESSKAINGTNDGADYVEVKLSSQSISWGEVDNLVIDVAEHSASIHLNSVWTAMPHKAFHVMPLAEISNTLSSNGSEADVALAFVGANQHVMDYTNRNGYCSFGNYTVMLSQVESNGSKNNPTILFKLKRTPEGKYVLKNHNGEYLLAPTGEAVHAWTSEESNAAVLEFDYCPGATLMAGCTSGNDGNAVLMKTSVNGTTYYLSASNKPTWWRQNPTAAQKAIYLFHWEGSH